MVNSRKHHLFLNHIETVEQWSNMDTHGNSNTSVLPGPFKVVPRLYKSKLSPLHISPIRRLNVVNFDFLPKFYTTSGLHNISMIQLDLFTALEWGTTSYYVKIQKTTSSTYKLGVLFRYDELTWGIYYLHRELKLKRLKEMADEITEEFEPKVVVVDDLEEDTSLDLSRFDMLPPPSSSSSEVLNSSPIKDDPNTDPEHYIKQKYYSALYSNADLMFFAKSTFARLKLLSGSDLQMLEKILTLPMLTVEEFNKRYDIPNEKFFVLPRQDSIELALKSKFFEINVTEKAESLMNDVKMKLKTRDIKLQLIMLMELIIVKNEYEAPLTVVKQELRKKPSLVRKRNRKRNLVPTLNGTLVDPNSIEDARQGDITLDFCKSGVRKYLDMLIVVNSVEGDSESSGDLKHQSDTVDFLSNIIVPFYYKKLTDLCKEFIKTVKGVSMKRRNQKKPSESKLPSLQPGIKLNLKPNAIQENNKTSSTRLPSLSRSNKSGLDELFMPKPSLKRSASMISSTKLLEKRTIDFSSTTSFKNVSIKEESKQEVKSTKGIFGTVQTQTVAETTAKQSICEIGETPVKKQKTISLELNDLREDSNLRSRLFEVAATPDNKGTDHRLETVGSSAGTVGDQTDLRSSLLPLHWKDSSDTVNDLMITSPIDILSSPIAPMRDNLLFKPPALLQKSVSSAIKRKQRELKTNFASLKKRRNSNTAAVSSDSLIPSSPRPGDPITVVKSPVVSRIEENNINNPHWLNGSPYQRPRKR